VTVPLRVRRHVRWKPCLFFFEQNPSLQQARDSLKNGLPTPTLKRSQRKENSPKHDTKASYLPTGQEKNRVDSYVESAWRPRPVATSVYKSGRSETIRCCGSYAITLKRDVGRYSSPEIYLGGDVQGVSSRAPIEMLINFSTPGNDGRGPSLEGHPTSLRVMSNGVAWPGSIEEPAKLRLSRFSRKIPPHVNGLVRFS
jgi:hypothetical protein